MLKRSAAKTLPSVCAQSEALPVASKCIDRAIMVDAFHHVLNQQTTVFELWRALAPGGRIIILEPDIHRPFVKILAVIEKMLLMRSHILSGEKIAAMFERLGGIVTMHYEENNVILAVEKMRV
jgi:demethylmenaquinone methyltransferase/2-methoxy-6-polyprenyl-1,4-benzoquinol methylase